MDLEAQLKLQSFLDGELPEREAREVANWLARDQEATVLLTELRQTRKALTGFEEAIRLPESREFYWSKIQREIGRSEAHTQTGASSVPLLARVRRLLMPVAGLAVLVVAALLVLPSAQHNPPSETALADSGAMVYRDNSAGATFVWLSYPADNEPSDDDETLLE